MHIHILAVGGIGMSGIARLLLQMGHSVSGTDISHNYIIDDLVRQGLILDDLLEVVKNRKVSAVVRSSAISDDDPQLVLARDIGIPVYHRAEILQAIFKSTRVIGITGAHGKTTSSALLAWVLHELGYQPSAYIGGVVKGINSNAWLGMGDLSVLELDESDGTFSLFSPEIMFIPYLELEHVDFYQDEAGMAEFFRNFILQRKETRFIFGLGSKLGKEFAGFDNVKFVEEGRYLPLRFEVLGDFSMQVEILDRREETILSQRLPLVGVHNVRNVCGVLQVCDMLGIKAKDALRAMASFPGVARRMDVLLKGEIIVVHDYAHHPTEIRTTLEAIRQVIGNKRMVAVFEPHRYSRFSAFWSEFMSALVPADVVLITPIYSASEDPIPGISPERFALELNRTMSIPAYAMLSYDLDEVRAATRSGDCLIFLGAGKVYSLAKDFVKLQMVHHN